MENRLYHTLLFFHLVFCKLGGVVNSKSLVSQFVVTPLVQLKLSEDDSLALYRGGYDEGLFLCRELLGSI